jgi:hypothetical protein
MATEKRRILIFSLLAILWVFPGCAKRELTEAEARRVLEAFYTDRSPESIVDRHLMDAGRAIVPHLIREIPIRDMPKRRYAIAALGKLGDQSALSPLLRIANDRSEEESYRGDALVAIWHLNKDAGRDLAHKLAGESRYLDRTIELLKEGKI